MLCMSGGESAEGRQALKRSATWDDWLQQAAAGDEAALTREQRTAQLTAWRRAPEGAWAHPREEHLLPLHVAFGAGKGDAGRVVWADTAMGVRCSAVQWG